MPSDVLFVNACSQIFSTSVKIDVGYIDALKWLADRFDSVDGEEEPRDNKDLV